VALVRIGASRGMGRRCDVLWEVAVGGRRGCGSEGMEISSLARKDSGCVGDAYRAEIGSFGWKRLELNFASVASVWRCKWRGSWVMYGWFFKSLASTGSDASSLLKEKLEGDATFQQ